MSPTERLPLFAVTAPGLEAIAAAELQAMGTTATPEAGGTAWEGTLAELYAANLRLRTASRVLVRVARFRARTFYELERHARAIPWERWVAPERPVRLRVTCRKSRLYHEAAVAERIGEAIERRVGPIPTLPPARPPAPGAEPNDEGADAQLFVVRFFRDRCTLSVDASGALLHRRGYRQALARAPLRETLAAAMLLASGWTGDAPLLDPFCGSGTIPIEAALLARRIAPGLAGAGRAPRRFAFQDWPEFDAALWDDVVSRALAEARPVAGVAIRGSDRNAGAITAARGNAERAGVLDDLDLVVRPLSAVEPPPGPGWLVTNPPYGVRVGERRALRDLYAAFGQVARDRLAGWTVAFLSADPVLEGQVRLPLTEVLRTRNGGIPVRMVMGRVEA